MAMAMPLTMAMAMAMAMAIVKGMALPDGPAVPDAGQGLSQAGACYRCHPTPSGCS
jgi:cytochrome c553